ncbi:right-handed parallel beta-helix repeat-containing protein [Oligoflexaceae bacterium]|nr:right-handed parallel beta-helix repeat-containing protein [Oligoflexaceae bacterium]
MKIRILSKSLSFSIVLVLSCSCSFVSSLGDKSSTSDSGDVELTTLESDKEDASAGAFVQFKAGDLPEGTKIFIQEGSLAASTNNLKELSIEETSRLASASVNLSANKELSADEFGAIEMSLPLNKNALRLTTSFTYLIVVYHVTNADGKTVIGVLTDKKFSRRDGNVIFKALGFGNYQAVFLENTPKEEIKEVETKKKVQTAVEEKVDQNENAPTISLPTSALPAAIAVTPKYSAAPNWNDYVRSDTHATCSFEMDDNCIHGGEWRKVVVDNVSSCDGLEVVDSLNRFQWYCKVTDGHATFFGQFRQSSRMADLIDFPSKKFKNNFVTVTLGPEEIKSTPLAWWSNPFEVINTETTFSAEGKIYLLDTDLEIGSNPLNSFRTIVDKVTIVGNNFVLSVPQSQPRPTESCNGHGLATAFMLCVESDGNWIELNIDSNDNNQTNITGLLVAQSNYNTFRHIHVRESSSTGIHIIEATRNRFTQTDSVFNGLDGIRIEDSSYNTFKHTKISNNGENGVYLDGSASSSIQNEFRYTEVFNNGSNSPSVSGIGLNGFVSGNSFFNSFIANNSSVGVNLLNSDVAKNVFYRSTLTNNSYSNIQVSGNDNTFVDNVLSSTNQSGINDNGKWTVFMNSTIAHSKDRAIQLKGGSSTYRLINTAITTSKPSSEAAISMSIIDTGVHIDSSSSNTSIYHFAASGLSSSGWAISINETATSNNEFLGRWNIDSYSNECVNEGVSDHPLINEELNTCVDNPPSFDFSRDLRPAQNGNYVGGPTNRSAYSANDDWYDLTNRFEVRGTAGPDSSNEAVIMFDENNVGNCVLPAICGDFDLSLNNLGPSDTMRNKFACPNTSETITHNFGDSTTVTFLVNAIERLDEPSGNNNGLCESGEHCIVSRNHGAYQGHGDLIPADQTTPSTLNCPNIGAGGTIENVTLWKYEINGY